MKTCSFSGFRSGFTLIELLTVIAIIGVLATIIIPTVGKVRENAQRAKSAANLRSIVQAYVSFSSGDGRVRMIPSDIGSVQEWAARLARDAGLNEASLYFIESDPSVASLKTVPITVGEGHGDDFSVSPEFQDAVPSYAVVAGIAPNAPASTTPVVFTRGLQASGEWDPSSPWQGKGGHIAFLDGHVKFYENLSEGNGQLVSYSSGKRTADIHEAIGPGAVILNNFP